MVCGISSSVSCVLAGNGFSLRQLSLGVLWLFNN